MSKCNIAITGVGGGVGQSILKSLQDTDYNLIALDGELLAAGLYSVSSSAMLPYAKDPNYISQLLEICKAKKISMIFPGLDAELMPLSLNRKLFESIGTKVIVSRPEVIAISDDKQKTYDHLIKAGVNVPYTCSANELVPEEIGFPLILKQKVGGARSKNVFVINDIKEWKLTILSLKLDDYVVMKYIEGDEYTCGTINLDDDCKGVIIMRRFLRDGDTNKCFIEKNEVVEREARKVVEILKPFGACNVQLRLNEGKPWVFEINARCSGTTAARALSGFNEPKLIADYLFKGIMPSYKIKEQTILRYWKEIVIENHLINEMNDNHKLSLNNPTQL